MLDRGSSRIAAIVLSYRTPDLVAQCLRSVAPELDAERDRVVVVDNDSGDDSARRIRAVIADEGWPHVSLVESGQNGGFAAGNNVGIRSVDAEAYLLLNSDTVVRPGAPRRLYDTLFSAADAGICSPRLEFSDGTPQISCFRHHSPVSELIAGCSTGPVRRVLDGWDVPLEVSDRPSEPDWTSFAAVMIRQAVVATVGLLDEGFFMYYEDADYCRAARRAGFRVVNEPRARVVHARGKSSPVKEQTRLGLRRPRYYYASRNRYFRKAYGPLGPLAANSMWTLGRTIAWLREAVGNKDRHTVERELVDNWVG